MDGLARYRQLSAQMQSQSAGYLQAAGRGVNPGQAVMATRRFFGRDAITVLDGGNATLWGVAFNPIFQPDSFLYSVKMGYLGTGLPFAIGAKLASPYRPVYCITGDGALGFNIMEMETALRERLPVVVIALVDDGWGMEHSAYNFGGLPKEMHIGVDLSPSTCYDVLAQGMGCYGERVETIDQLGPALGRAVASGRPAVLHVVVDPTVNVDPPGFKEFRNIRTLPG
jgi:acetolactate synthase-1/2/3 large subunit